MKHLSKPVRSTLARSTLARPASAFGALSGVLSGVLFGVLLSSAACQAPSADPVSLMRHEGTVYTTSSDGGVARTKLAIRRAGTELILEAVGEVEFTEDDRDFVLREKRSSVALRTRAADGDRIWTAKHGEAPQWSVNGQSTAVDESAREWLASQVLEIARNTPLGAEPRAERILRTGGVTALVAELEQIRHPSVKALYLERLGAPDALTPEQLRAAVEATKNSDLSSSARAKFYVKAAAAAPADRELTKVLLDASRPMLPGSDQTRVIDALAERSALDDDSMHRWLELVYHAPSDSQRVDLYLKGLDLLPPGARAQERWLNATLQVHGVANQERLLMAMVARKDCTPSTLRNVARRARGSILSTGGSSRVLSAVIAHPGANSEVLLDVLGAVETQASIRERANVLLALLEAPELEREVLERIVAASEQLPSQSERARVSGPLIRRLLEAAPAGSAK
jgi:hypothetical protein